MRNLTTTLCLTIAVLLGVTGCVRWDADAPQIAHKFEDGKHDGQGTYTHANGDKYVGESKDGKHHGQGTYTFGNGDKYAGEWMYGKKHGQGTYTYAVGHKYVGEWKDDKANGRGTATFADGDKYVGEWKNNHYNGAGTRTFANSQVEEGFWKDGRFLYSQKITPTVTAKKSPPPSPSAAEIENKKLQRRIAELEKQKQSKPKQIAKKTPQSTPKSSTSGSGFFISKLGHVITNQHVVDNCKQVTIGDNSKKQVTADVLETDRRNDLALLKISSLKMASSETKSLIQKLGIKIVPLASDGLLRSEDVDLGEKVLVAGYPYGEMFSNTIKVTGGMISANRGLGDDTGQFQMDAAVQPGSSGGPIYDENGNIVGVVIAQLNKMKFAKQSGSMPENVNFGIKASTVRQFLSSSGLPTKWSKRSKVMSTRELAKIAKKQTVMVMCHQ